MLRDRLVMTIAWAGLLVWGAPPVPAVRAADEVDYVRDVKPLLTEKCGACHSAVRQKGGLRLDAGKLIHAGGESGPVVIPAKADESPLLRRASSTDADVRMPPEGEGKPLSAAELAVLRRWIDAGAKYPQDEVIAADPRAHWSFRPAVRPPVPEKLPTARVRNAVDAFVVAKQIELGFSSRPEADRDTLLRRVTLDLTGLPPSRDELLAFRADTAPEAYERVVDRLLASPEHGERWARHWMDVWRYCDWHGSGNEIRYSQRHLWRWRDWIVNSLQADKGYDRMIVEMLAGDEVAPDKPEVAAATGFIGRNWYKFDRNVWMRELVEHTAVGFLGMTLKCARCHDHKFDPIAQEEYYQFRAFFEPHHVRTDRVSANTEAEAFVDKGPVLKDGVARVFDMTLDAPTYVFQRGDDRYPLKDRPVRPGVPSVLGGGPLDIQTVSLPLASYAPMLRPEMVSEWREIAEKRVTEAEQLWQKSPADALHVKKLELARGELRALQARLAADRAKHVDKLAVERVTELATAAAKGEREVALLRAEVLLVEAEQALVAANSTPATDQSRQAGLDKATKKVTEAEMALGAARTNAKKSDAAYTPLGEVYPTTSTGRRLALARWIASPQNPRTARVAVNHIWLRHFGRPLVDSVADFGLRGKSPSHPELLDWLAVELVEHKWSMKHLHRLIVTSATYRQAATAASPGDTPTDRPHSPVADDSRWLTRWHGWRLEAEAVRDSVLAVAGTLDRTRGGREIPFTQDLTIPRRSLYFQTAPNRQSLMLELFDVASPEECYDRKPSVIPQQSLALMNSSLTAAASRKIADRHAKLPDGDFVEAVFEEILSRAPTQAERERCLTFIADQSKPLTGPPVGPILPTGGTVAAADPKLRAREGLVLVLFNHNDFVTVR